MSYILNALRKSEKARRAGQKPTLETSILESPQPRKKWLRWVIAGLISLNVIALINLLFFRSDEQTSTKDTSAANLVDSRAGKQPTDLQPKSKIPLSAKQPAEPFDETPQASITNQPSPSIADMVYSRQNEVENRPSTVEPETSVKIEKSPDFTNPIKSRSPERRAIQIAPIRQTKRSTPKKPEPGTNANAPLLSDMAPEFRRRVPRLNVNVFVFADDPADRFVVIDMKKYRANQQIAEGMQLEQILPNSLLVRFNGKTFRIKRP